MKNNLLTCVFLDYSKAFDSFSHALLIKKLSGYGFEDVEWFISYLTNRSQCVRVGNAGSPFRSINRGVPQGSVLGPTLFNLFLNDITSLNLTSKILLYADDVVLYQSGNDISEIKATLRSDLDMIYQWSTCNLLSINPQKTKSLMVGWKFEINNTDKGGKLLVGTDPLEWVNSFCYLGLEIDENLNFNATIERMHHKAAFKFRTMYVIKDRLTTFGRLTMAKSMIIPYLDYGILFMSSCQESSKQRLQYLQNKVFSRVPCSLIGDQELDIFTV